MPELDDVSVDTSAVGRLPKPSGTTLYQWDTLVTSGSGTSDGDLTAWTALAGGSNFAAGSGQKAAFDDGDADTPPSLTFDGGDYYDIASFGGSIQDITLAAVVSLDPEAAVGDHCIMSHGDDNSIRWRLLINKKAAMKTVRLRCGNGTAGEFTDAYCPVFGDGPWAIVATRDDDEVRLFVNGVEQTVCGEVPDTTVYSTTTLRLGASEASSTAQEFFDGSIQMAALWNDVLDDSALSAVNSELAYRVGLETNPLGTPQFTLMSMFIDNANPAAGWGAIDTGPFDKNAGIWITEQTIGLQGWPTQTGCPDPYVEPSTRSLKFIGTPQYPEEACWTDQTSLQDYTSANMNRVSDLETELLDGIETRFDTWTGTIAIYNLPDDLADDSRWITLDLESWRPYYEDNEDIYGLNETQFYDAAEFVLGSTVEKVRELSPDALLSWYISLPVPLYEDRASVTWWSEEWEPRHDKLGWLLAHQDVVWGHMYGVQWSYVHTNSPVSTQYLGPSFTNDEVSPEDYALWCEARALATKATAEATADEPGGIRPWISVIWDTISWSSNPPMTTGDMFSMPQEDIEIVLRTLLKNGATGLSLAGGTAGNDHFDAEDKVAYLQDWLDEEVIPAAKAVGIIDDNEDPIPFILPDSRAIDMAQEPIYILGSIDADGYQTLFDGVASAMDAEDAIEDAYEEIQVVTGASSTPHVMIDLLGGLLPSDIEPSDPHHTGDSLRFNSDAQGGLSDWLDDNAVYHPESGSVEFWINSGFGYQFSDDGSINTTMNMGGLVKAPSIPSHYKTNVLDNLAAYDIPTAGNPRLKRIMLEGATYAPTQFGRVANNEAVLDDHYTLVQGGTRNNPHAEHVLAMSRLSDPDAPWNKTDPETWTKPTGHNLLCWVQQADLSNPDLGDILDNLSSQGVRLIAGPGTHGAVFNAWHDALPVISSGTVAASTTTQTVALGYAAKDISITLDSVTKSGQTVTSSQTALFNASTNPQSMVVSGLLDGSTPIDVTIQIGYIGNSFIIRITDPSGTYAGNFAYTVHSTQ